MNIGRFPHHWKAMVPIDVSLLLTQFVFYVIFIPCIDVLYFRIGIVCSYFY